MGLGVATTKGAVGCAFEDLQVVGASWDVNFEGHFERPATEVDQWIDDRCVELIIRTAIAVAIVVVSPTVAIEVDRNVRIGEDGVFGD